MIEVGDGHALHVEQLGHLDGIPAVFLHGGPGSGCRAAHRELFDPERFRAVLFDQRGAGRSTPQLRLEANTTGHLIADIESIRSALGIDRWLVVGGSWGSTLALAYAERFPERVTGIVLRAVFLGTRREVEWAFVEGPKRFRPDLLVDFLRLLPAPEQDAPLTSYWRRILDPDPAIHLPAASMWHHAERVLSNVVPKIGAWDWNSAAAGRLPPTAVLEAHYLSNDCFLEADEILGRAGRLAGIPGRIVQSRYDLLCPPASAFALAAAWPDCILRFVEGAGHGMDEPGVVPALVQALDELAG